MTLEIRLRIVRIFLRATGVLLLAWWPLSHWFYSDLYHGILGFGPVDVDAFDGFIKIIGSCGVIPVLLMLLAARDPLRNRTAIATLTVFGFLLGATFAYLTAKGVLPIREYFNAGLSFFSGLTLFFFYPWKHSKQTWQTKL